MKENNKKKRKVKIKTKNFYRLANSIFGKVGRAASEEDSCRKWFFT